MGAWELFAKAPFATNRALFATGGLMLEGNAVPPRDFLFMLERS
jgi:hypothetical protein